MKVSDFVIKFLEEKISTVFTVSGGGSIFLCDALYKSKKLNMFLVTTNKLFLLQLKVFQELQISLEQQ